VKQPFTVAVDGPAASGKGTLARQLAKHYNFAYLDTGLLYRGVGLAYLESGKPKDVRVLAEKLNLDRLDDPRLRDTDVAQAASIVAAMPEVRTALLDAQRRFAREAENGAILDGRDIGTVILPNASAKLFVTADLATRAMRRFQELEGVTLEQVQADIQQRDERDKARKTAPLQQAENALLLETTNLSIEEAFLKASSFINERMKALKSIP
jgi:cytidylate kinase